LESDSALESGSALDLDSALESESDVSNRPREAPRSMSLCVQHRLVPWC
jgi:hypothetical protein